MMEQFMVVVTDAHNEKPHWYAILETQSGAELVAQWAIEQGFVTARVIMVPVLAIFAEEV